MPRCRSGRRTAVSSRTWRRQAEEGGRGWRRAGGHCRAPGIFPAARGARPGRHDHLRHRRRDCSPCRPRAARPSPVTELAQGETGHFWPSFLPDGRHFVYLAWSEDAGEPCGVCRGARLEGTDRSDGGRVERDLRRSRARRPPLLSSRRHAVRAAVRRRDARASPAIPAQVAGGVAVGTNGRGNVRRVSDRRADLLPGRRGGDWRPGRRQSAQFGWVEPKGGGRLEIGGRDR